jgi:hypothetical protein
VEKTGTEIGTGTSSPPEKEQLLQMCLIAVPFSAEASITYHFLQLWLLSAKSQSSIFVCQLPLAAVA